MAQFKFLNDMNSLLNIDGPLTKGPVPRWQRKAAENSATNLSLNSSRQQKSFTSTSGNLSLNTAPNAKTPTKRVPGSEAPLRLKKTPAKTPNKSKSPSRSTTPTPSKAKTPLGGDRFIPSRTASNFDLAHYKINLDEAAGAEDSPTQKQMQNAISENLQFGNDINKQRILSYQKKPPAPPQGFQNPMRVLYTQGVKTPNSSVKSGRYIPQAPDRILDAPDIVDDYYLNLMDWSGNNILAAALGAYVYLWNAATGNIEQLLELQGNDYVCSLSWIQEGDYLAVGTTTGTVELWDCTRLKRLRTMDGHSARVGSLSWNQYVLSSGCRSGQIIHHDVRQRDHRISIISGHTQEVCGLKWSTDGKYLASGGNDNVLNVWQAESGAFHSQNRPLHVFTQHLAAVKALAWCPWQPHILASGGGTADRHIRFWNCNTGASLSSIDAKSQVCALLWSPNYRELVSAHGFANNQIVIWKYPAMTKVAELTGHTARVLHLAMSPDHSTLMSAGADETLRLWNCFTKAPAKAKEKEVKAKPSVLKQCIR